MEKKRLSGLVRKVSEEALKVQLGIRLFVHDMLRILKRER
jgi:hypothetical protein